MNAVEAMERVTVEAGQKAVAGVRFIKVMTIGQVVRQGDIYLHRVAAEHPRGEATQNRQLAIGTTRGSRHVAEAPAEVYVGTTRPEYCDERTLLGPVVVSRERIVVTHPEHAHYSLPAGTYQVTHQTDARTLARVQD